MITVLAFDFGMKSIGVAVGNSLTLTAAPLEALKAKDGVPNWDLIEKYIKDWSIKLIVVGLPLNMDGSEQEITNCALKFGKKLFSRFKIEVIMQDERLTSTSAREHIFNQKGSKALVKGKIDSIAACLILESYLDENY